MIRLTRSLLAWNTPDFDQVIKAEIAQLGPARLPLQQALSFSSYVADSPRRPVIHNVTDDEGFIHVTAGIFYAGIIAGCSCADDPTPVDEVNEYCLLRFDINKATAEASVVLLDEGGEN